MRADILLPKSRRIDSSSRLDLKRWLSEHDSESPVLSNQPSLQIPFQRWFKFKEAYSPKFVIDCVNSLEKYPATCLDPFGGSGTTALTCQFLGIKPTTIEVNPFLGDLIDSKMTTYDLKHLKRDYLNVVQKCRSIRINPKHLLQGTPPTLMEPGVNSRWIFSSSAAKLILSLRREIEGLLSKKHRILFRVILGSILVPNSNVVVNGKGRKYRRQWEARQKDGEDVLLAFRDAFTMIYTDLLKFSAKNEAEYTLLRGDSRALIKKSEDVDFVIFSPPYPNSFDYTDIYNVELWMLGYLKTSVDNKQLRRKTLRSHVQFAHDFSTSPLESPELRRVYAKLCERRSELWDRKIPEMVLAYFDDMRNILQASKAKLKPRGKIFMAVGDSMYAGVLIDTSKILTEVGGSIGFKSSFTNSVRSMRSSAQQGGERRLSESLVVLS